jgi:hypothetical protein
VVDVRKPFGGPEHVLHYLARYTHRVAISNHRLIRLEDGKVTFRWKDYAHGGSIAKALFGTARCRQTPVNRAFRENHKTFRLFGLAFSQ